MSAQYETGAKRATGGGMGFFERYLTLWVALCIVAGITLGYFFNGAFQAVGRLEVAQVNLPVALLVWLMIIPMLLKIDLRALKGVRAHWRGVSVTLFVNWAVKPFSMALLGWLFIGWLFRPWLPAEQIDSYIAGLIILAAAPCTRHGVRMESPVERRAPFHAVASGAQRRHHDLRLRPPRWLAAWPVGHHRAVGYPVAVGAGLYRGAAGDRQCLAQCVAPG
jgi:hypothetical protein